RWLGAREILKMATAGGARSARLEGIGAIAPGQRADLVLLDLRRASFAPRNDLVQQTVYAENGSSVDLVMVDGRIVVEGGRVLTVIVLCPAHGVGVHSGHAVTAPRGRGDPGRGARGLRPHREDSPLRVPSPR